jgi:digeranylgeranylglycerophospholipid reductase
VVGCGPGGAIAGKFAALDGARTLIVEEKRQIGFPIPDSMGIIYSKSEMEEITEEKIDPGAIYSIAEGLAYISPSGNQGKPQPLQDGVFINRQLFEKSLATGAIRKGAEIALHTRAVALVKEQGCVRGIMVKNGSELITILCSLVIIAEGSYQKLARGSGISFPARPDFFGTELGCELVGVRSLCRLQNIDQIYLDETGQGMYRYVVPYDKDRFSIGSGSPFFAAEKRSLKQRFNDFLTHLEAIGVYDFSKASPVSMVSTGIGMAFPSELAADGVILVGNAAGAPVYGSHWGGIGLMVGACWTGKIAGKIAAGAARKGDARGRALNAEYKNVIDSSFKNEEKNMILSSLKAQRGILGLSPIEQDRAIEEIGLEIAALHFCAKGATASTLQFCLEPVQNWLKERKGEKKR